MWNYDFSNPTLTNCTFSGNSSGCDGGGMLNWSDCSPMLTNCTFSGNSAISNGGVMANFSRCKSTLTNCILWGNTASSRSPIYNADMSCSVTVSYSNVQGGWPGETNIQADPYFADPNNGDCHLRSEAGRWDPATEDWVVDDVTSPCIDRGDPNSTVGDEPDPNGGIINMGAYGGTAEASMSIGTLPPLPPIAHWALDETGGVIAHDSVGSNDATVIGMSAWQPEDGKVEGALEFDGATFVVANFVLDPSDDPFSVLVWVQGGAPGQVIVSQDSGSDWLAIDPESGGLMTAVAPPEARHPTGPLVSDVVVTDGLWHRIALVWDGTSRSLFVDGTLVATDEQGSLVSCTGGLNIGCGNDMAPSTFFTGLIDDVRIYNRAVRP